MARKHQGERRTGRQGERDLGCVCLATAGPSGPRGMLMRERPLSGGGREWGWSGVFSRIPDLREEGRGGQQQGRGSLRGQGSELSGDPTTTTDPDNTRLPAFPPWAP